MDVRSLKQEKIDQNLTFSMEKKGTERQLLLIMKDQKNIIQIKNRQKWHSYFLTKIVKFNWR